MPTVVNRVPRDRPAVVAPATMASEMSPTIRPYSRAFEPDSLRMNDLMSCMVFLASEVVHELRLHNYLVESYYS